MSTLHGRSCPQPHLDPLVTAIEERDVLERVRHEVGAELAVDDVEHVAVELGGDSGAVVVGRLDHGGVLDEVGPEQESVIGSEQRLTWRSSPRRVPGGKFPIVPPSSATSRGTPSASGTCPRWRWKSPITPWTTQPVVLRDELLGGVTDDGLGDVERDVAVKRAGIGHRIEQDARLLRGPGAELDQLAGAGRLDDLAGLRLQDRLLGARRVVLGQLADAVEQLGAARVVEMFGRKLLERPGEAVEHVVGEHPFLVGRQPGVDLDLVGGQQRAHHATSFAIRIPEKICRRWG